MDTSPARGPSRVLSVSLESTHTTRLYRILVAPPAASRPLCGRYFSTSTTLSVIQHPANGAADCRESVKTYTGTS